ncbi:hypothetical protein [Candidatus Solirubrobacter pratensis]|uniref:hypothetical protein n=1 Tax=Candidatus Solirubrobacter pratensis TaxID=1298857 RepID=UPI000424FE78|nr:hypothetical protein [Candidatus Solirubrobacter pratensis]
MADTALILGLAGIGGTLTAGLVSPAIGARFARTQQQRQFAHDQAMRDTQELRTLLDEIAARLEEADEALGTSYQWFIRLGLEMSGEEKATKAFAEASRQGRARAILVERLTIRRGAEDGPTRAAAAARDAMMRALREIDMIAALRHEERLLEANRAIEAERAAFKAAREQFVRAALELVGSHVVAAPVAHGRLADQQPGAG